MEESIISPTRLIFIIIIIIIIIRSLEKYLGFIKLMNEKLSEMEIKLPSDPNKTAMCYHHHHHQRLKK